MKNSFKSLSVFIAIVAACALGAGTSLAILVAQDQADNAPYNDGWQTGDNGGSGFGAWTIQTQSGGQDGFNGNFIGTSANNAFGTTTPNIDTSGEAFGTYANTGNSAVGFRDFTGGQLAFKSTFAWSMDNGFIDDAGGAVGLTLRNGSADSSASDYNAGVRFEFQFLQGNANYSYIDSTGSHDTGIAFTGTGLRLALTLTGINTYSLSISNLASGVVSTFSGTLGGTANSSLDSFAVYNRFAGSGGSRDAFFNLFEVTAVPEPSTVMLWATGMGTLYYGRRRHLKAKAHA